MTEIVTIGGGNKEAPINMRQAGSTSAKLIGEIPQGDRAELISWGANWCEIRHNYKVGYVMTEFVHQEGSQPGEDQKDGGEYITRKEAQGMIHDAMDKMVQALVDAMGRG